VREPLNQARATTGSSRRALSAAPEGTVRRPARRPSPRGENLARALRCIADGDGEVSRADISARTALNRSTSGSLVDELISAGLVREVGIKVRSTAGRPPTSLALVDAGPAGLGIEVNVDHLATCVVDLAGNPRYRRVVTADQRGRDPRDVLRSAMALGAAAVHEAEEIGLEPQGMTLAVPGLVDVDRARVVLAPNLGWHDLTVGAQLDPVELGLPPDAVVTLENEANCAALSERRLLRSRTSFLYVHAGIGVGSALVLRGELHRGRNGWSGEVGHLTVEHDGPACGCGGRGCLEQYAGQEAVLRAAGLPSPVPGTSTGPGAVSELVKERVDGGDPRMLEAVGRAGRAVGLAVAQALNLLDIELVVLGGIYYDLGPLILPVVRAEVASRYAGARWAPPRIVTAVHGLDAPALGAARSVVQRIIDDPSDWLDAADPHRR